MKCAAVFITDGVGCDEVACRLNPEQWQLDQETWDDIDDGNILLAKVFKVELEAEKSLMACSLSNLINQWK